MHATDETPDLLGDRALPCSQEGISHGMPPRDHIAAGFEELSLCGVWLEVSVTELLGDALYALVQMVGRVGIEPTTKRLRDHAQRNSNACVGRDRRFLRGFSVIPSTQLG